MSKYTGELGKGFKGDEAKAMSLQGAARLLVQQTINRLKAAPFNGRGYLVAHRKLADGSWVHCMVNMIGQAPVIRTWIESPTSVNVLANVGQNTECFGGFIFVSGGGTQSIAYSLYTPDTGSDCKIWMQETPVPFVGSKNIVTGSSDWSAKNESSDLVLSWSTGLPNRYRLFPVASHDMYYHACGNSIDPIFHDTGITFPAERALFIRGKRIPVSGVVQGAGASYKPSAIFYFVCGSSQNACDISTNTLFVRGQKEPLLEINVQGWRFAGPWCFSGDGLKATTVVNGPASSQAQVRVTIFMTNAGWAASFTITELESGNWTGTVETTNQVAVPAAEWYGPWFTAYNNVCGIYHVCYTPGDILQNVTDDANAAIANYVARFPNNTAPKIAPGGVSRLSEYIASCTARIADGQAPYGSISYERKPECSWYPVQFFGSAYDNHYVNYNFSAEFSPDCRWKARLITDVRWSREGELTDESTKTVSVRNDRYDRVHIAAVDYAETSERVVKIELSAVGAGVTTENSNLSKRKNWFTSNHDCSTPQSARVWFFTQSNHSTDVSIGNVWELTINGEVIASAFGGFASARDSLSVVDIHGEQNTLLETTGGDVPPDYEYYFSTSRAGGVFAVSERVWLLAVDARSATAAYIKLRVSAVIKDYVSGDNLADFDIDHESTMHEAWLVFVRDGEEVVNEPIIAPTGYGFSDTIYAETAAFQLLPRMFAGNEGFENDIPIEKLVMRGLQEIYVRRVWDDNNMLDRWPNPHDPGLIAQRLGSFYGYSISDELLAPLYDWQTKENTYEKKFYFVDSDNDRVAIAQAYFDEVSQTWPDTIAPLRVF